ncbi:hypothetical protein [Kribbella sp. CA-247076]|uniref:hypothetical protein n=1 Tax=Kribbella sp. CA-247076 TaxID=3239941 RepID=UPI003D8D7BB8
MSKPGVWIVTIGCALAIFGVIVFGTYLVTDEVKAWSVGLGGACFAATVAIGSSILTSRVKPEQPKQASAGQQTGTAFATGGSIAGLAAGNDITIGTPPAPQQNAPKQPAEGD